MKFRITNRQDFCAGVFFMLVGAATMVISLSFRIGTGVRMGPGYFPMMLGGLLLLLGVIVAVQGLVRVKEEVDVPPLSFRPLFLVLGSIAVFGLLLNKLGFIVCTVILVGISSLAYHQPRWKQIILSAAVLTIFSVAVFGLGFILGPLMEENLRRAMLLSRGDPSTFVTRPLSAVMLLMALTLLVIVLLPAVRKKREVVFVEDSK